MRKLTALLLLLALLLSGCVFTVPLGTTESTESSTAPTLSDGATLQVHYIDVGQADCMLLECEGKYMVIDGGNRADSSLVIAYLQNQGIEEIEAVVNTHPHEDHVGGLPAVLAVYPVKAVYGTSRVYSSSVYDDFLRYIDQQGQELQIPKPGDSFFLGSAKVTFLGPVKSGYEDLNDTSLVLMVQFGDNKFLFTGDMESVAERDLVESGADLKADVLKVGHHGSYSSTSYLFLREVMPKYGVITVGRNNEYGHPHGDALRRLTAAGLTLYRTDLCRDLVVATDGDQLVFLFTDAPAAQTQPDLLPEGEHLTVAQAILLCQQVGDRETVQNYYLTGTVTEIANNTYGNLYLTDETRTIYVYGVSGPDGELDWTSLPHRPQVGDRVTLYGSLILYRNEMPELKNAWLVEEMEE